MDIDGKTLEMVDRSLGEPLKYLDVKELLVTVSCVCKGWKNAVYSDELMLHMLENRHEPCDYPPLSLYKRVKKSYKGTRYLLHIADEMMLVWDLHHPATPSIEIYHPAFLSSSRYTLLSPKKAVVTGGVDAFLSGSGYTRKGGKSVTGVNNGSRLAWYCLYEQ